MGDWMYSLQALISTLRPADLLDVGVVSVFVYAVISWVRRARSRFVLLGLGTLVGLYFAARLLKLYLTLFLFQVGLTVALVTLVVIFQEDIRRAFERLATTRLLREGRARGGASGPVDTVVTAAKELADRKIGALIVFKGTEPLERHLTGGVILDGRISPSLLHSIFDTGSAGHDGAVIIENGILTTFAAQLPLSTRADSDAPRGTRHTAAMGLSERSDALVVVVSEERSTISIAQGGTLQEIESPTDLRHRLDEFQQSVAPAGQDTLVRAHAHAQPRNQGGQHCDCLHRVAGLPRPAVGSLGSHLHYSHRIQEPTRGSLARRARSAETQCSNSHFPG